jgi:gluconolactonase
MRALLAPPLAATLMLLGATLPPSAAVTPIKVAELPTYTEGVVLDSSGAIYVSEPLGGTISRVKDGVVTIWAKLDAPNGHRILPDGTHLVCDGKRHAVMHLDAEGKVLGEAASRSGDEALRAPNDLAVDPNGGFYFTDPGGSSAAKPIGTVHHVDARGLTRTIASGLAFPNGIVLSADGKTLFVGESGHNRILKFALLSPGRVGPQEVFATLPARSGDQTANEPDGMALDEEGNLFVAHYGMRQVQVLSPQGRVERSYNAGNLTTSNVAFGGARMDQLYVTGALGDENTTRGGLFRLDLPGVRGRRLLQERASRPLAGHGLAVQFQ